MPQDEPCAFPVTPQMRLRLAMRGLEESLARQAQAVAELRCELAALGGAMASLRGGLASYDAAMETLAARNAALHRTATQLAASP